MARKMRVGILTAGGDSPGLNAAIRAVGKAAIGHYGMELIGFRDGFRGLVEDRAIIGKLNIGDLVVVTYTEALAISVEKAPPK